mgnify:CR=1 FL=1
MRKGRRIEQRHIRKISKDRRLQRAVFRNRARCAQPDVLAGRELVAAGIVFDRDRLDQPLDRLAPCAIVAGGFELPDDLADRVNGKVDGKRRPGRAECRERLARRHLRGAARDAGEHERLGDFPYSPNSYAN